MKAKHVIPTGTSRIRDAWRASHGYTQESLEAYATGLEWILDAPRYQGPNFTPPEAVRMFFGMVH